MRNNDIIKNEYERVPHTPRWSIEKGVFLTPNIPIVFDPPLLLSPLGAEISIFCCPLLCYRHPTCNKIKFEWTSIQGTDYYEIQISDSTDFYVVQPPYDIGNCLITKITNKNYIEIDLSQECCPIVYKDTIYWRVRAKFSGLYSRWSAIGSFRLKTSWCGEGSCIDVPCGTCETTIETCTTCDICDTCDVNDACKNLCQSCDAWCMTTNDTCYAPESCTRCEGCDTCDTCDRCMVCEPCENCQSICQACEQCDICEICQNCESVCQGCDTCDICNTCDICQSCQSNQSTCQVCDACDICERNQGCNTGQCSTCLTCQSICEVCETDVCRSGEKCSTQCELCETGQTCSTTCEVICQVNLDCCQVCQSCERCDKCEKCQNCDSCMSCQPCESCENSSQGICIVCDGEVSCPTDNCGKCMVCEPCEKCQTSCQGCDTCDSCDKCERNEVCNTCDTLLERLVNVDCVYNIATIPDCGICQRAFDKPTIYCNAKTLFKKYKVEISSLLDNQGNKIHPNLEGIFEIQWQKCIRPGQGISEPYFHGEKQQQNSDGTLSLWYLDVFVWGNPMFYRYTWCLKTGYFKIPNGCQTDMPLESDNSELSRGCSGSCDITGIYSCGTYSFPEPGIIAQILYV